MGFALEVSDLVKIYPARPPVEAVRGVSFRVRESEIVALLGPNGAGKTTTIKCILNLVVPTRGEVKVYGHPHRDLKTLYRRTAAVLEGNRNIFWRLSPRQNLEVFAAYAGVPARMARSEVARWLKFFDLAETNAEVRHLSRGNQQKVAIASALVRRTPLLVLDEPTLGLDVEAKRELVPLIRRLARTEGKTILLTSHQMDVVEALAERIIIIQHGRIVAEGSPDELRQLFETHAYEVTVQLESTLPSSFLERWSPQILQHVNGDYVFRVTLRHRLSVYRLLRDLEALGAELKSVRPDMPDLEEAYFRLVKGHPGQEKETRGA